MVTPSDDTPCMERPTWACLLCPPPTGTRTWRQADPGYRSCTACLDRIRTQLADIRDRYARLDTTPTANADLGSRGAPGFGSRSPASDHVIAMRDRRSSPDAYTWRGSDGKLHKESEHPPLSVFGVLDTIAWDIAETRGISGPTYSTVDGLTRWIDAQLDWATRQDTITDLAEQLRAVQAQLRPVTGDRRRRIGVCPNTVDSGDTSTECGAPLYAPTELSYDDSIHCRSCGRAWPRSEWLRLCDLLDIA